MRGRRGCHGGCYGGGGDLMGLLAVVLLAMRTLSHCFIVGHVHDELIMECSRGVSVDVVCEQMSRTPPWVPGLILNAAGFEAEHYKKDD